MKWWGWGDDTVSFTHEDKPELGPFLARVLGIDVEATGARPVVFERLPIPGPQVSAGLLSALQRACGGERPSTDPLDRLVHARGKSLRDLVRNRRGDLGRLPDVVVRPRDEAQIAAIMAAALAADAIVVPFGGGTNISGSLEAPHQEPRTIVSVDLERLDRVVEVDEVSRLARVQAGVFGPSLESQLNARGWTMGHFPDSFPYSTLGGWIATRSSGMQSDKYGDVSDLTRGLRVVTPAGTGVIRAVPSTSTGPSVREMVLGSEGRLGIITEATVQVHRLAPSRVILGYLFASWSEAVTAMRDLAASELWPSLTRVSDGPETVFSFATRKTPTMIDRLKSGALAQYLRRKNFDTAAMCLSFVGYEGTDRQVAAQRRAVGRILSRHGAVCIGRGPGALYDQKKFDTPYIRDYLLDRGALADVSETAAPWSVLPTLYDRVMSAARSAFDDLTVKGYIMCHLSHSYRTGACLYFTFGFAPAAGRDPLEQYDVIKSAIQQQFVDCGATLSHHHAVGTEHARWLEQDISAPAVAMLRALFEGFDPGSNLNPGKIVGERPARALPFGTPGGNGQGVPNQPGLRERPPELSGRGER